MKTISDHTPLVVPFNFEANMHSQTDRISIIKIERKKKKNKCTSFTIKSIKLHYDVYIQSYFPKPIRESTITACFISLVMDYIHNPLYVILLLNIFFSPFILLLKHFFSLENFLHIVALLLLLADHFATVIIATDVVCLFFISLSCVK